EDIAIGAAPLARALEPAILIPLEPEGSQERTTTKIRLGRYEAEEGDLPLVCMRCGAPSAGLISRELKRKDDWMRIKAPLCTKHQSHWTWRSITKATGFLGILGVGAIFWLIQGLLYKTQYEIPGDVCGYFCLGLSISMILWLAAAFWMDRSGIRAIEISKVS